MHDRIDITQAGAVHLWLPIAASAPFFAYLPLHSLHDRVQGHWPVPLFGALAICAAVAADRFGESPRARVLRVLTPALGFAVAGVAFVLVALPFPNALGRFDPTLPLRGWPQFGADVEALRVRAGAAWTGTESYGVYAQLNNAHASAAPLLEVVERDRYWATDPKPDFTRPGLIVDLARRMKREDVLRCFTSVEPAGPLVRAGGPAKNQRYFAFLVSGPRRDVWITGCPDEIRPGVWK